MAARDLLRVGRYTTNVHMPGRIDGRVHRVRLTATGGGTLLFAEHYVDGVLKGCGTELVMLPDAVRAECEARLETNPLHFPLYWRTEAA